MNRTQPVPATPTPTTTVTVNGRRTIATLAAVTALTAAGSAGYAAGAYGAEFDTGSASVSEQEEAGGVWGGTLGELRLSRLPGGGVWANP